MAVLVKKGGFSAIETNQEVRFGDISSCIAIIIQLENGYFWKLDVLIHTTSIFLAISQ